MCSTHMSTKPLKSPINRLQINRSNGRMLHFISSFVTRIHNSANVSDNVESTSPTTCANSLYSGSKMNSMKLRWAELCAGFFVNLRLRTKIQCLLSYKIWHRICVQLTFLAGNKRRPKVFWQNQHNSLMDMCLRTIWQTISM